MTHAAPMLDYAASVVQQLTLPRLSCMGPVVRRWVRGLLAMCPRVEDAEQIAAELVADTVRYGQWSGFVLTLTIGPGRLRLVAADDGQPGDPSVIHLVGPWPVGNRLPDLADTAEDHGRGLQVIGVLADRWGHEYDGQKGRHVLWATCVW